MKISPFISPALRWAFVAGAAVAGTITQAARNDIVAVNAKVFNGYTRLKLPDGTFKPERYAFGEGGRWDLKGNDPSLDALPFMKIAETIAGPLRDQGFLSATDPAQTDLMILVFWGATLGVERGEFDQTKDTVVAGMRGVSMAPPVPGDAPNTDENRTARERARAAQNSLESALTLNAMENDLRDQNNLSNARILGYTEAYVKALDFEQIGQATLVRNIVTELEGSRYFVVLKAYDFRVARKEKKLKLLWETRYSIRRSKNRFDEQLLSMTSSAAEHFGQITDGLIREDMPEVKIELGTPTVVETAAPAR